MNDDDAEKMRKTMNSEDWFALAASEAEKKAEARIARQREAERREAVARRARKLAESAPEAKAAASVFGAVADGSAPMVGTGPTAVSYVAKPVRRVAGGIVGSVPASARVTPDQALEIILDHVRGAGGAEAIMQVGSEWMARVTNSIATIIRANGDDS